MHDELVKQLRFCAATDVSESPYPCDGCSYDNPNDYGLGNASNVLGCSARMMLQAADAIEELSATISKMEIATRWIPVTEQLIHSGWYLVACNEWGGSAVRKAIYDEATRKWLEFPCGGPKNITKFVTHYMSLPDPPKEERA